MTSHRPGDRPDRAGDPGPPGGLPERPPCPFCGGERTTLHSEFGSHASVATYWCRRCHSPFEFIRWAPRRQGPPRDEPGSGSSGEG